VTVESIDTEAERSQSTARWQPVQRLDRLARDAPAWWAWIGLAALLVAGGAVLAYETRGTTFWADEWSWIIGRRSGGAGTFLHPHNQHLSLVPVAVYKILFATAGLRHYGPYRAVLIACDLVCAALVFAYVRRRLGGFVALLAGALILLFGPGWQDILWPFQIGLLIAVGAGVGALLMLDRGDRRGDIGAAILLMVSLGSEGLGVAIAVGVAIEVLQRRRRRDWWIFLAPLAVYVLWWLAYQHTSFNRHALTLLPRFVFDAAAGVLSSLTGLASIDVSHDTGNYLTWGAPLLVIAVGAIIWRLLRRGAPPRVPTLLAILLSFWIITGLARAYTGFGQIKLAATGDESRYLYMGAVFAILLASELLRGRRPSLWAGALAGVLVAAAVVSNIAPLRDASRLLQSQANSTAALLETLDLERSVVSPGYVSNGFFFGAVTARGWFSAKHDLGSPFAEQPLSSLPDYARQDADAQMIDIQRLGLTATSAVAKPGGLGPPGVEATVGGVALAHGACAVFRPAVYTPSGSQNLLQVIVPSGGLMLEAGRAALSASVRRYSSQFLPLGTVASSGFAALRPARDLSSVPWHAQIASGAPFSACSLR
jgi:hypothetical protein